MRFSPLLLATVIGSTLGFPFAKRAGTTVSTAQYADLVRYTKFAAAALPSGCTSLYGAPVVTYLTDAVSGTNGYIARDDSAKQLILGLRGSSSIMNFLTDGESELVTCTGTGITFPSGALCHVGFLTSYNTIAAAAISTMQSQLKLYPTYSIAVVGHSLGGALASHAALSMRYNFPSTSLVAYSFGQPRTGNKIFAAFHDKSLVDSSGNQNFFRGVHTTDGVPQVLRQGSNGDPVVTTAGLVLALNNPSATSGYWHHGIENWQFQEPATAADTNQYSGEENSSGQDSIYIFAPLLGINSQHLTYFGQSMTSIVCPS